MKLAASALVLVLGLGGCAAQAPAATPIQPTPTATPSPTPAPVTPSPSPASDAAPTRVVVAKMKIDLPIIEPKVDEPYPLCDVAAFLTYYSVPGMPGLTYLYAHAQKGMFLPLLTESLVMDGKAMLGRRVRVYTDDDLMRTYEITEVHRHVMNLDIADSVFGDALILQTSETDHRDGGKLTVIARPVGSAETVATNAAHPPPKPRVCGH